MNQSIALLALLLTIGLQLQSCKDDESPEIITIETTDALEGDWEAVSYTATEIYYLNSVGQVATFGHSVEGFDLDYEISFQEDTYTSEGSYAMDIWTVDNNGSYAENDSLFQSNALITGGYWATESTLTVDSIFFPLTLESTNFNGLSVEQILDYEINSTDTELTINQFVEYSRSFDSGGSVRITSNSISVWRKL